MARDFGETSALGNLSGRLIAEVQTSFRSGVTAARRSLEASGLGSNPRGGAASDLEDHASARSRSASSR
jgi:hypothetical protein